MLRAFMHSTGARLNTKGRYGRPVSKCWNYRCNRLWMEDSTMDLQNLDLQGGSLQISTEVVGKIAHWKWTALPRYPAVCRIKS